MDQAITAILGVVVGGVIAALPQLINSYFQGKRERYKNICEVAMQDHQARIGFLTKSGGDVVIPPLTLYIHYHLRIAKLVESDSLSIDALRELADENADILDFLVEFDSFRRDSGAGH